MTASDLLNKLEEKGELPTLPSVITKVLRLIRDPKTSAADIGKILSTDIALSSKILKIVNSVFYGFPQRVSHVSQAVVILGFDSIKSAVLGVSVISAMHLYRGKYVFNWEDFWAHSLGTAAASRAIAKKIKFRQTEEAFIAGLIHDIGKLIMDQYIADYFKKTSALITEKETFMHSAEKMVFGFNHDELGELIVAHWNFPSILSKAVRFHHNPLKVKGIEHLFVSVIHLANIISLALGLGKSGENFIPTLDATAWQALGLNTNDLDDIFEATLVEYSNAQEFLDVVINV